MEKQYPPYIINEYKHAPSPFTSQNHHRCISSPPLWTLDCLRPDRLAGKDRLASIWPFGWFSKWSLRLWNSFWQDFGWNSGVPSRGGAKEVVTSVFVDSETEKINMLAGQFNNIHPSKQPSPQPNHPKHPHPPKYPTITPHALPKNNLKQMFPPRINERCYIHYVLTLTVKLPLQRTRGKQNGWIGKELSAGSGDRWVKYGIGEVEQVVQKS